MTHIDGPCQLRGPTSEAVFVVAEKTASNSRDWVPTPSAGSQGSTRCATATARSRSLTSTCTWAGRTPAQDCPVALNRGMQPPRDFQQGILFSRSCLVEVKQRLYVLHRGQQAAVFQLGDLGLGHACPARGFHAGQSRVLTQVSQPGGQPLAISEITFRVHSPPDSRAGDDHVRVLSQFCGCAAQYCGNGTAAASAVSPAPVCRWPSS